MVTFVCNVQVCLASQQKHNCMTKIFIYTTMNLSPPNGQFLNFPRYFLFFLLQMKSWLHRNQIKTRHCARSLANIRPNPNNKKKLLSKIECKKNFKKVNSDQLFLGVKNPRRPISSHFINAGTYISFKTHSKVFIPKNCQFLRTVGKL